MRTDRVELYQDTAGDWRWRYLAQNGHVLADSGQGYTRRIDCRRAARRVTGHGLLRRVRFVTLARGGQP